MALPAVPRTSPVLAAIKSLLVSHVWDNWFISLARAVDATPQTLGLDQDLVAQSAALPATTVLTVPAAGVYRVSASAVITRAATISSSLQLTIRWTTQGVASSVAGAAMTANVPGTLAQLTPIVSADAGTALTIEAAYSSVGATTMQYTLSSRVEAVP